MERREKGYNLEGYGYFTGGTKYFTGSSMRYTDTAPNNFLLIV
jgi:hypothetical protein